MAIGMWGYMPVGIAGILVLSFFIVQSVQLAQSGS